MSGFQPIYQIGNNMCISLGKSLRRTFVVHTQHLMFTVMICYTGDKEKIVYHFENLI